MSKSIELSLHWNQEEALKASKVIYDYDMRHSLKRYIGWLFIAMMQFGIVAALKYNAYGLLLVSSLFVLYWYYGRWWLRSRLVWRYYQKKGLQDSILHIRCEESGITIQSRFIPWEDIFSVVDTKSALLVQSKEEPLYIPYSSFDDVDDLQKCLQFLKEKGKI